MDKTSFTKLISRLCTFYQSAKLPSSANVDLWFAEVAHIPDAAIEFIEKQIYKDRDTLPKNVPKAMREAYDVFPHAKDFFKYDPVEDFRFPIAKMHEALKILDTKGYEGFYKYCRFVQMPKNDVERVITKNKVITGQLKMPSIRAVLASIGSNVGTAPSAAKEAERRRNMRQATLREPGEEG